MKIIREILGSLIIFLDWLFAPRAVKRAPEIQAKIDKMTSNFGIYEFPKCPFCVKTRRAMKRLNLCIELRNAKPDGKFKEELVKGGGQYQVPCLQIRENGTVKWMYESSDIIKYLETRVSEIGS